jgi:hypothetical protein
MEPNEIITKFKAIRKKQLYVLSPIMVMMILFIVLLENREFEPFGVSRTISFTIAGTGILLGLLFSLKNWRCPACDSYLRKNTNPKFCPKCGVKLQEN